MLWHRARVTCPDRYVCRCFLDSFINKIAAGFRSNRFTSLWMFVAVLFGTAAPQWSCSICESFAEMPSSYMAIQLYGLNNCTIRASNLRNCFVAASIVGPFVLQCTMYIQCWWQFIWKSSRPHMTIFLALFE